MRPVVLRAAFAAVFLVCTIAGGLHQARAESLFESLFGFGSKPKPKPQPKPKPKAHKELGSTLREHVDDYMGEHLVEKHVAEHLAEGVSGRKDKRISNSVKEHMGSAISDVPVQIEVDPLSTTTTTLMRMLRNPTSVKNAILINEILQPPRVLRK